MKLGGSLLIIDECILGRGQNKDKKIDEELKQRIKVFQEVLKKNDFKVSNPREIWGTANNPFFGMHDSGIMSYARKNNGIVLTANKKDFVPGRRKVNFGYEDAFDNSKGSIRVILIKQPNYRIEGFEQVTLDLVRRLINLDSRLKVNPRMWEDNNDIIDL
jgi:hypothetical protein